MRALVLTAVAALSFPAAAIAARPGTLDQSFGDDGRVETRVPGGRPAVAGIESLPRGKLLLAGTVGDRRLVLIRYRRDGRLDKDFGRKVVRSFDFDRTVHAEDMTIDAKGRIVVAGALGAVYTPDRAALVLRFDRAGRLDSTFDGDGIALVDFGGKQGDTATGLALQPDGRIVIAAAIDNGQAPVHGCCTWSDLGVARLDDGGRLDATFGEGGFTRIAPDHEQYLTPTAVGVQPNGGIVVAANHSDVRGNATVAVRLFASGAPDPAFGEYPAVAPGRRYLATSEGSLSDLAVEKGTGNIVVAGSSFPIGPSATSMALWYQIIRPQDGPETPATGTTIDVASREVGGTRVVLPARGRAVFTGTAWRSDRRRSELFATRTGYAGSCFGREGVARIRFSDEAPTVSAVTITQRGGIVIAGPLPWLGNGVAKFPATFQLARLHNGRCRQR